MMEALLMGSDFSNSFEGVEFLGELGSEFLTYTGISSLLGVTEGNVNTTSQADKWLHFRLDGKELIVSKVAIRSSISYDQLYSHGLIYGTDDNGLSQPRGIAAKNQFQTVSTGGKDYKCRLLRGCDQNPSNLPSAGYDLVGTQMSEWSRLFYPIITNDPNIKSYTGPMLSNYLEADLQMRYISSTATPGSYAWCQDTPISGSTSRVLRGTSGPSYVTWNASSSVTVYRGWRGCLELL